MDILEKIEKYIGEAIRPSYLNFDKEEENIIKRTKIGDDFPERETPGLYNWDIARSHLPDISVDLVKEKGTKSGVEFVYNIGSTLDPDAPGNIDKIFKVLDKNDKIKILKQALKYIKDKI